MSTPALCLCYLIARLVVPILICASIHADSDQKETPEEILAASLDMYSNLQSYECEGKITVVSRGESRGVTVSGPGGDAPNSSTDRGPPRSDYWSFQFAYTNDRQLAFRLYRGEAPRDTPVVEINTREDGTYELINDGSGPQVSTNNLNEMVIRNGSSTKWLLPFLLNLLEPELRYNLLSETPQWAMYEYINGKKHRGAQLRSTTRKWIWIDSATHAIRKVRYLSNGKSRRLELELLHKRLEELDEDQVEIGNLILQEIDALEDRPEIKPIRFYYELTHQSFDKPLTFPN